MKRKETQEELFDEEAENPAPLAHRMRPKTLDEYAGQQHILAPGKMLRRAIEGDMVESIILYGPPGTGKTTLARIITNLTMRRFVELNATESTVADIRKAAEEAKNMLAIGEKTIVFIDEIHRFNKGQQDALLPHVETGRLALIGATTQNPFFALNSPLISRSQIFQLQPLGEDDILSILKRALAQELPHVQAEPAALKLLARQCDGDARRALNGLELACKTAEPTANGVFLSEADAAESIQRKVLLYDRDGDGHYDTISAFIKSLRGSDPDAALYWLARLLASGEDPRYVARRLVIHAAEDVGMADPTALLVATAAQSAVETIGLPEAKIPLAQAAIHIALAPKSNSACAGISAAMAYVESQPAPPVPLHLRDTHYDGASKLGNGKGYRYPHDYVGGVCHQTYLPDEVDAKFYAPSSRGREGELNDRLIALGMRPEPSA
jgi:putative ATPase